MIVKLFLYKGFVQFNYFKIELSRHCLYAYKIRENDCQNRAPYDAEISLCFAMCESYEL